MNTKLKGSALVAAVGMVFALGVTAPATAVTSDRPENVVVTAGFDFAIVEFDVPAGTEALDLIYVTYPAGPAPYTNATSFYAPASPETVTGLAHKVFVLTGDKILGNRIQVATVTAGDVQNWDTSWYRIATDANAPRGMTATAGDTLVANHIDVALTTESAGATSYEYSTDGGLSWLTAPAAVDGVIDLATQSNGSSFVDGDTYGVWVRGVNASGKSLPADAGSATPYSLPGAPEIGSTVVTGNGSLTVELTTEAPANGRPVTRYVWSTDGTTVGGTATTATCALPLDVTKTCITATGLTNKVLVSGVVFAGVNLRGTGEYSGTSIEGTPFIECTTIAQPSTKFAVSKSTLTAAAKARLNTFAAQIVQSDCASIDLQAHRVKVKSARTNRVRQALGVRRSAAVRSYLISRGVTIPITTQVVLARDNRTVYGHVIDAVTPA